MKVKKKIIRQNFNYSYAKDYYEQASICPNCGNTKKPPLTELVRMNPNDTSYIVEGLQEGGKRVYECKKCGCIWTVKRFKEGI